MKIILPLLAVFAIVLVSGCVQNGAPTSLTDVCAKDGSSMTLGEATNIGNVGECGQIGTIKATAMCNEYTGTWWIDFTPNEPQEGCNPACVVNVVTREAEVNWRCTGALPPEGGELPLTGAAPQENGTVEEPAEEPELTLDTVALHNSATDCWMVLDGKVYDFTEYIPSHPTGSSSILEGCGTDATTLFETRPMGSGTPHSTDARTIAESYYLGDLV